MFGVDSIAFTTRRAGPFDVVVARTRIEVSKVMIIPESAGRPTAPRSAPPQSLPRESPEPGPPAYQDSADTVQMHSHVHRPSAHLEAPWQAESSDFPRRAIHAQPDSQWQPVTPQTCLSLHEPYGAPSANSEPNLLADLWASGFRCHLSCVADASTAEREIGEWLAGSSSNATSRELCTRST